MRRLFSNRRGLLAGAAALVGAGLSRLTGPDRAEATHGVAPPGPTPGADTLALHVDSSNVGTDCTQLTSTGAGPQATLGALLLRGTNKPGLVAFGGIGGDGIHAPASGAPGVYGISSASTGVRGESKTGILSLIHI